MGKNKNIIFLDLDGTLLDIDDRWYQLHLDLAAYYCFNPIPKKKYLLYKKNRIDEKKIIKETNIDPKKIHLYIKKRIVSIELWKYLVLDVVKPGVIKLLRKLSRKYRLVLITKRKKLKNCLAELKKIKLVDYFSKILITQGEAKYTIIKKYFHDNEIKDALIVGDTEDDYELAKRLHCKSVLVTNGARSKKALRHIEPDYKVNSLEGLTRF